MDEALDGLAAGDASHRDAFLAALENDVFDKLIRYIPGGCYPNDSKW